MGMELSQKYLTCCHNNICSDGGSWRQNNVGSIVLYA